MKIRGNGSFSKMADIIIDSDQQRVGKAEIRYNKNTFVSLVNSFPGMAYRNEFIDGNWEPVYVSKGSLDLLGYKQEYFLRNKKKIYSDIIAPEDYNRIWQKIDQAVIDKKPFQLVYRMKTASGLFKWVWEYGKVAYSRDGKPLVMEGYITDVTRQKEFEIKLSKENESLKSSMKERYRFGDIIGKSASMQKVYELIIKAAASSANIIIYGESGTGKELVARMIHKLSDRKEKPFVAFNCGAVPDNLLESELFGYKKGAFTGADRDNKGYLGAADEGTFFLDEIEELSQRFQIKLLRVLEGRGYKPLGSTQNYLPNLRFIGATNSGLAKLVDQGKMRLDFLYRVDVLSINLPPLRERREDIPFLIEYFIKKYDPNGKMGWIVDKVFDELWNYSFPGNVRELENLIQRYVIFGYTGLSKSKGFSNIIYKGPGPIVDEYSLQKLLEMRERELIIDALERNNWRRGKTAAMLQITPRTLYRKIQTYRIIESINRK